jgi:hypothetical protein
MPTRLSVLLLGVLCAALAAPAPVRLLVVTGGHDYPTSFYTLFEQDGIVWDHATSNEEAFRKDLRGRYDAARALRRLREDLTGRAGAFSRSSSKPAGGLLVLHHAIISYQDSDWFRDLVGGRYLLDTIDGKPASTYLHDQDMNIAS